MDNSPADRRSLPGPFPGEPGIMRTETSGHDPRGELPYALEIATRQAVTTAPRHWRVLVMPTGKGLMRVGLDRSWKEKRNGRSNASHILWALRSTPATGLWDLPRDM